MSYVDVPTEAICAFLRERGFAECAIFRTEVVFDRRHDKDPRYLVRVYTSVRRGAERARGKGQDAIRVCAVYDDGRHSRGVGKFPVVKRTAPRHLPQDARVRHVLERMLDRMREAYARCSEARAR